MKKIFTFTSFFTLLACSSASAIQINVETSRPSPDTKMASFFLESGGEEFDSIDLSIRPDRGEFLNVDDGLDGFTPRGPDEEFTFVNPWLFVSTSVPGGQGWSFLEGRATPTEVRIAGGPLGRDIETPSAPGLFLANVVLSVADSGTFHATFVNDGTTVATHQGVFFWPEPSCLMLLGVGLMRLVGTRNRTRTHEELK